MHDVGHLFLSLLRSKPESLKQFYYVLHVCLPDTDCRIISIKIVLFLFKRGSALRDFQYVLGGVFIIGIEINIHKTGITLWCQL